MTSAAWGHRSGRAIALAMLPAGLAAEGTALDIDVFGEAVPATVLLPGPVWDADFARIRA